jgi:hypothetical protein
LSSGHDVTEDSSLLARGAGLPPAEHTQPALHRCDNA